MSTKPKRRLDGSARPRRPKPHNWPKLEPRQTAQRLYHEYHSAENQRARTRTTMDTTLFKRLARDGRRKELIEKRNQYYERLKETKND